MNPESFPARPVEKKEIQESVEERFKDSKVRNEDGTLMQVYHYSDIPNIEQFSLDFVGKNFEGVWPCGHFG